MTIELRPEQERIIERHCRRATGTAREIPAPVNGITVRAFKASSRIGGISRINVSTHSLK